MRKRWAVVVVFGAIGLYLLVRPSEYKTTLSSPDAPLDLTYLISAGVPPNSLLHVFETNRGYDDIILARKVAATTVESLFSKLTATTHEADSTTLPYIRKQIDVAGFPVGEISDDPKQWRVGSADDASRGYCRLWYDRSTQTLLIDHYGEIRCAH